VFVERLWRTVKYEHVYLHDHATPRALEAGLAGYFPFYNEERLHAALDYLTPAAVYTAASKGVMEVVQINTKSRAKKGKPTGTHTGGYASAAARDLWNGSRGPLIPSI